MSIRVTVMGLLVAFLAIYAWRDWFKSLCGLILLMAFLEHPDMPKNIMGIQGLNPWNVLMFVIVLAWLASRRREGLKWDMPRYLTVMLLLYLGVVIVGFLRMITDRANLSAPVSQLISDYLINVVKWVVPGLLLFDGCRSRERLVWAGACILGVYVLLALQVIRYVPLSAALEGGKIMAKRGLVEKNVGYNAVNMSMMLAGGSWAILATAQTVNRIWQRLLVASAAGTVVVGQALTGGRMGYAAWATVGLVMCFLRWRRYLLLLPVGVMILAVAMPGPLERLAMGFGRVDAAGQTATDTYEVTAGRLSIWPYVIERIGESPTLGHGREAMARTGLAGQLMAELNESFPHPHNAYLEGLLDNGVVGFAPIIAFYALVVVMSARMFLVTADPLVSATGGISLALTLAFIAAGLGAESFYPKECYVGMWGAIFLMFRVSRNRERLTSSRQTEPLSVPQPVHVRRHLPRHAPEPQARPTQGNSHV